jgi:hypothetical protein
MWFLWTADLGRDRRTSPQCDLLGVEGLSGPDDEFNDGDFTQVIALAQADDDPLGTTLASNNAARFRDYGRPHPIANTEMRWGPAAGSCCQTELFRS